MEGKSGNTDTLLAVTVSSSPFSGPRFIGSGSDCSMWLAFSYCSIHRVNIYALSVVVF